MNLEARIRACSICIGVFARGRGSGKLKSGKEKRGVGFGSGSSSELKGYMALVLR